MFSRTYWSTGTPSTARISSSIATPRRATVGLETPSTTARPSIGAVRIGGLT
jgi:hypothetical protein